MENFKSINFERSNKYESNIDRHGEHSCSCIHCGLPTAEKLFVHMTTCGRIVNTTADDLAVFNYDSQGAFPIGPECAKKFPAEFIFKLQ